MARSIKNMGMGSLQKISTKLTQDAIPVKLKMNQLVEHPDNEYLFGGLSEEEIRPLAEKIKKDGFKGAINVWELPDGKYMIFDGTRRKRAEVMNGSEDIPCFINSYPEKETDRKRDLLMMNIQDRRGILGMGHPIYTSRIINYMKDILKEEGFKGNIRDQLSEEFNIPTGTLQKYSSLVKCSPEVLEVIKTNKNPDGWLQLLQASSLAALPEEKQNLVLKTLNEMKREIDGDILIRESVQEVINTIKEDYHTDNVINTPKDTIQKIEEKRTDDLTRTDEGDNKASESLKDTETKEEQIKFTDEESSKDKVMDSLSEPKVEEKALEPTSADIKKFYEEYIIEYYLDEDRSKLKELLIEHFGKVYAGGGITDLDYQCSPRGIKINNSEEITWARFVQLINILIPKEKPEEIEEIGIDELSSLSTEYIVLRDKVDELIRTLEHYDNKENKENAVETLSELLQYVEYKIKKLK